MRLMLLLAWIIASVSIRVSADEPPAKELEAFFETKVRPILVEHCHACHGTKKQEAGLRLDSAGALRKGSENGPVVVPGDVQQSRLIQAVRYSDDSLKMPPKGKLPDQAV